MSAKVSACDLPLAGLFALADALLPQQFPKLQVTMSGSS